MMINKRLIGTVSESKRYCIECYACESRCPFDVKIVDHMAKARELFGE